jgi:osmotically-inducible protein OsmY
MTRSAAKLDVKGLSIDTTSYRQVTLADTASSSAEHDEAVDAAWSAAGVTEVDDQIQVAY